MKQVIDCTGFFCKTLAVVSVLFPTLAMSAIVPSDLPSKLVKLEKQVTAVRIMRDLNEVDAAVLKVNACARIDKERAKARKAMKKLNADVEKRQISSGDYNYQYDQQQALYKSSKKDYKQCFADNVTKILLKDSDKHPELMKIRLLTYADFDRKYSELKSPYYGKKKINVKSEFKRLSVKLGIEYEKYIRKLSEELKEFSATGSRWKNLSRYGDFMSEIDRLDEYTQFSFVADHTGKASLKFNTPEEKLRENIKAVIGWVSFIGAKLESLTKFNVPVDAAAKKLQEQVLSDVQKMEGIISKRKTKELTNSEKVGKVYKEYKRLLDMRDGTLKNLQHMSDRYMCNGLLPQEKTLAWLYNEHIPNHRGLNALERKGLMDRIRKAKTVGFGLVFDKATYQRLKKCPKPKHLR